jgi:multidrug/hemolysin transport system permease protein
VGIALNVVLFSIGAYGISLGLRSSKGWSTLASISGTLVGFLGGVYLPMGFLPKGVASVLKFLPFLHGASILRKSCVQAALDKTFAGCPSEIATNYQQYVGITVKSGGHVLSTAAQVGIMVLWLVAALVAVFAISRRKHLNK